MCVEAISQPAVRGRRTPSEPHPIGVTIARSESRQPEPTTTSIVATVAPVSEVSERYSTIAHGFSQRAAAIRPDQWVTATPCTEWTVRDLVAHVVRTQRSVHSTLGGEAEDLDEDGDLLAAFSAAQASIEAALANPAQSTKVVSGMFGEQPFESLVSRLLCGDTLIHTWDLARATGQDEALDPVAVEKCAEFLAPIDDAIRRPGGFSEKITPEVGADDQTRLLNFCGRSV
jgi:uncharacterized protein (TIGR03086 family)